MSMTDDQFQAILALLGMIHDEQKRTNTRLRGLQIALRRDDPGYRRNLGDYRRFDWSFIGAEVLDMDDDGPTRVEYNGFIYTRRSGAGKFGEAIWYSRPIGRGEYARLITFKDPDPAEPLNGKVAHVAPEPQAEPSPAQASGEDLFDFRYENGEEVNRDNAAELQAYTAYRRAHGEESPASKAALRQWYKLHKAKLEEE